MAAEGFAAIPNWMVRDPQFDIYDLAVYTALASHTGPGGVRPSQATLAAEARCSERQVRMVIQRLADAGVVEVTRRRRKGTGSGRSGALTNGYVLHPHGRLAADEEPAPHAGSSDQPAPHDRPTGTAAQLTPLIEEEPIEETPSVVSPTPREVFEEFWALYPRKVGKSGALAKWLQLERAGIDLNMVLEAALRYSKDRNLPELRFVPHPTTWLNQGRWEDEPIPGPATRSGTVEHGRSVDEILRAREASHLRAVTS